MSAIPPLTITEAGAIPTPPATLNALIIENVAAIVPDYTANLPGTLIEDLSSTVTAAAVQIDQARVDAVNSLVEPTMSPYVLNQLGQAEGIPQGQATNTSAYVVFSGPAGYLIVPGFLVSDGTHQYAVQDGGTIGSSGSSSPLYVVATQPGIWTPGANTITQIVTSVPSGYTLTVTNPNSGTPGSSPQSVASYRAQIMQARISTVQGTASTIRTLVGQVAGVNPRLISVLQASGDWEVIVGGGDPYEVAGAIYQGILDLGSIVGSQTTSRNVTVTITSPPNSYNVTFVSPPNQVVTLTATWNTTLVNFTGGQQVNQLAQPALTSYLNSIQVGQPINLLEATAVFQNAVSSVLDSTSLSTLDFTVYINGVQTSPNAGTSIIPGDPESYFSATATAVTVVQG